RGAARMQLFASGTDRARVGGVLQRAIGDEIQLVEVSRHPQALRLARIPGMLAVPRKVSRRELLIRERTVARPGVRLAGELRGGVANPGAELRGGGGCREGEHEEQRSDRLSQRSPFGRRGQAGAGTIRWNVLGITWISSRSCGGAKPARGDRR